VLANYRLVIRKGAAEGGDGLRVSPVAQRNGYIAQQTTSFGAPKRGSSETGAKLIVTQADQVQ
jgi:hypothetical protein